MAHVVGVLALNGVVAADLSIPCAVFDRVAGPDGGAFYEVRVCGEADEVHARHFGLRVPYGLDALAGADTLVIPGIEDPTGPVPPAVLAAIRRAWTAGARVTSICTGAFVLAATGLLDGRRATTHWLGAGHLAACYPAIDVDPNTLFVDEGRIVTSAGASAGLDMCLHLVRRDLGQSAAAQAARLAVAPLDRDGGQAQFIRREPPSTSASLAPVLEWMLGHVDRPLSIGAMAARAGMSGRTFARRFQEQTGTTPMQWFLLARIRRSQELLESGGASIDQAALASGFASPVTFRASFRKLVGVSPATYRARFNAERRLAPKRAG
ncbi:helix-turn-helix domain-containing protein [Methylobacterium sp. NMS14P]|uniref:GlxA family transcriptional regulator n=1 Tax=Methylobacterium sp. NMS14P TaxID=2894310 RepID=UPI00235A0BEA|nr:helix-turn-helix domain-containing protein [Methylobacterium sp. NMS14P]WCS23697.1 helix-turn-helix domain-containing protein [Methylobacterium sp. NMS14P]